MNSGIVLDPGKLCIWPVAQSIQLAYTEAIVRLSNALNLNELAALPNLGYRFTVRDPNTGEVRAVVQKGSEETEPTLLPFEIAISILTIIRLKDYVASYAEGRVINVFFNSQGETSGASDMDRLLILFEERPEFSLYELSKSYDEEGKNGGTLQEEDTQTEETPLQATKEEVGQWKGADRPVRGINQPVRRPQRPN